MNRFVNKTKKIPISGLYDVSKCLIHFALPKILSFSFTVTLHFYTFVEVCNIVFETKCIELIICIYDLYVYTKYRYVIISSM